jgi:hypothetical protein
MKNFNESKGQMWRLRFDAETSKFVWRCLGPVLAPASETILQQNGHADACDVSSPEVLEIEAGVSSAADNGSGKCV